MLSFAYLQVLKRSELNQAFLHVLVTYKNEDQIKNEGVRVAITFHPLYKSKLIIPVAQGQLTTQSSVRDGEIRTDPSFFGCPYYLQE